MKPFFQKFMSTVVAMTFLVSTMGTAFAATPETVQAKLDMCETDTYGQPQTGAIMERINKLEKDYDGTHRTGSMMARTNAIYDSMYTNTSTPSILAELNGIEWTIRHEVSATPVQTRITDMETEVSGKTSEGTYTKRIRALADFAFGANQLPIELTTVPANTLVKIALAEELTTKNVKKGDTVHFTVADDVIVDGRLIFAKGEPGTAVVEKVQQARNFGRNAKLELTDYKVKSMDGTIADAYVGEESEKEMKQLAMAAGASLAGIVLLGPIGIIGGAFVKGKDIDLPAGTEMYVQTSADESLFGVTTTLAAE
ncbi:hypothetical protein [uncultured Selenomonas sp.]|uniref:hypothetical protein n=1 Tax=uncultured Selenomonas sp. TaxID=159275 RepID=UPI0025D07146|nr:hypothetical protein [uncultured Selenomonas sp.]